MADSTQTRRILRMHAAHRTVGVSGIASSFRPCSRVEPHPTAEPDAATMRVSLVSCFNDGRSRAAIAAFERILLKTHNVDCERVDLASVEMTGLGDADCAIVFGRGLQIVGQWSAFDADDITEEGLVEHDHGTMNVELAAAARWHPVLDGVRPFSCRSGLPHVAHVRMDTTNLLIGRRAGSIVPIAWTRHGDERAFCTVLGDFEDFGHSEFVRLLLNAIEWVRG